MRTESLPTAALKRHAANARAKGDYTRAELAGLIDSIREVGLLSPLVVTPDGDGFTILAGHRRHAALRTLGIEKAPCVVVDADEAKALAILLAENGQHVAVDTLKEADTVARLVDELAGQDHPYDRAATLVGKSPSWIRDRLRLRALSPAWRKAFADASSPIHEWPSAHLAVVAALPEAVQDAVLADNEASFAESVPLAIELRRLLSEYTRDLSQVPWNLADGAVIEGAPACIECPRRDICEGFLFKAVTDTKKPRCLDAVCFQAKTEATLRARIAEATAKYGDALAIERSLAYRDVVLPENIPTFEEFHLVPMGKAKGGFPVLRLKTLKVVMMGQASKGVEPAMDGRPTRKAGPRSMSERRRDLEKRRTVRALELLRGSLLGHEVDVGTEKRPEKVKPPALDVPSLDSLVGLCLAFGTGRSVDDDVPPWEVTDGERLAAALKTLHADAAQTRERLWAILRAPIAKALQPHPGITLEAVEDRAGVARVLCGLCGTDWASSFLKPAADAIKTPKSWTSRRAS